MRGGRFVPYDVRERKERLRRRLLVRRGRMRPADLQATAAALRDVLLSVPEVSRAAVVAAYVSIGSEPGTGPLLDALHRRGVRVLLPVLKDDHDLDWARYHGADSLASGPRGLLEPIGPRLGPSAIASADAVLVPGLAVDRTGLRLGRGGGSYDRVLPRLAPDAFSCVLLHDGELLDEGAVAADEQDQRVRAAALPSGLIRFPVTR